jgi:hypothetical protein
VELNGGEEKGERKRNRGVFAFNHLSSNNSNYYKESSIIIIKGRECLSSNDFGPISIGGMETSSVDVPIQWG